MLAQGKHHTGVRRNGEREGAGDDGKERRKSGKIWSKWSGSTWKSSLYICSDPVGHICSVWSRPGDRTGSQSSLPSIVCNTLLICAAICVDVQYVSEL